jgi:hypothetical protein
VVASLIPETDLIIRRATVEDADEIIKIRAISGLAAYQPEKPVLKRSEESPFWFPDNYRANLCKLDHTIHVGMSGGELLGFVAYHIEERNGENQGHLGELFVRHQSQGQGVGK